MQRETRRLSAGDVQTAAELLRSGGLVGIPTETVYGLGANGLDSAAVKAIFQAKGRPQDNPLILHIPEPSWLERYCQNIPPAAWTLAERFWPGPLTMILPRKPVVSDAVTAGLDTVGMRCPAHPLCRAVISAAGVPVAAPSGNTSGKPSPTTARHMLADMDGKIDGILDGGPCTVGVESTIIDLTVEPPRLLRPGGVTLEELEEVLGGVAVDPAVTRLMGEGEQPRAPGMKYRHYAPRAPVTVVQGPAAESAAYIAAHLGAKSGVICFEVFASRFPGHVVASIGAETDKAEHARRIFDALRAFDSTDVTEIFAQCPDETGIGLAVCNRLNKAAGFHIVRVKSGDYGGYKAKCRGGAGVVAPFGPLEKGAPGEAGWGFPEWQERRRSMTIIGITGGSGAGKTTVLEVLREFDAHIIDCDQVYHQLLAGSKPMLAELRARFGDVFDGQGALDRKALGKVVFRDPQALAELNAITHKHVMAEVERQLAQARTAGRRAAAVDAIALLESGLGEKCHVTVAVTAPVEMRVARLMAREGISEDYARSRIAAQKPDSYFEARCDYVLYNDNSSVEVCRGQAQALFEKIFSKEEI